jgi:hypothetical protein
MDTAQLRATPPALGAAPAQAAPEPTDTFTFNDMRLRPGDRIQLQLPPSLGPGRHIVKVIGYLEHGSLLVAAPAVNGMRLQVRENDKIVARVFSSQKAFAFDCFVERVCTAPYPYLHLSFPEKIQGSVIRKSPRIKTRIPAAALKADNTGEKQNVLITNISADGALVQARAPLYEKGQEISLAFQVKLHHIETALRVNAIIRSIMNEDPKDGGVPGMFSHGLQFMPLQPNDSMILQSLIYQQMIEQPQTVI